jgi:hypothetical protein
MQAEFAPRSLGRTEHGMECPLGGLLNPRRLLRFVHNDEFVSIFLGSLQQSGIFIGGE